MRRTTVWIASTDAPDEPAVILGVFGSEEEASTFLDRVMDDFPADSLAYAEYPVGWTYDRGARTGQRFPG